MSHYKLSRTGHYDPNRKYVHRSSWPCNRVHQVVFYRRGRRDDICSCQIQFHRQTAWVDIRLSQVRIHVQSTQRQHQHCHQHRISLKLRAKRILRWWHGEKDFRVMETAIDEAFADGKWRRAPHFRRTTKYPLAAPVIILSFAIYASRERTPVSGR